jgi:hypothetical protein
MLSNLLIQSASEAFLLLRPVNKSVDILRTIGDRLALVGDNFTGCGKMRGLSSEFQQLLWYEKTKINTSLS